MRSEHVRTFDLFERVVDGPRRYIAPPPVCAECGGAEPEHERWCSQSWRNQVGAEHVARDRRFGSST